MQDKDEAKKEILLPTFQIPVYFMIVSVVWIAFSYRILSWLIGNSKLFLMVNVIIDSIFVIGTACMLFILINRQLKEMHKQKRRSKEREEQLRLLINAMPEFVCYKDSEMRWLEANEFALRFFQLEGVDYKGKTDYELANYTAEHLKGTMEYCFQTDKQAMEGGVPIRVEEMILAEDGSSQFFDTVKVPVRDDNGQLKGLVVIGRNITHRKKTEERLEASKQHYKSLFEQNPDAILSLDKNGDFLVINTACEELTGYKAEELFQKECTELIVEEDFERASSYFMECMKGNPQTYEITIKRKDGVRAQINVKNIPILVNGEVTGFYAICKDVTEWRAAEEMLRKSDRLSIAGQLAAGVAHEIRNPLASLSGFVQLLQKEATTNQHYYEIMLSELNRINFIVSEFLRVAKPQVLHFESKDLHAIFKNVIAIAETQAIMNNVQIITDFDPDIPAIYCEENQLKQVFLNILKNAIEAMPKGGDIRIEVKRGKADGVSIRFMDEGCGIDPDRIRKLGEPFYSTKEKGTGLGLMVSYKIIEAHQGCIHVTSELEKGTTVEVRLPSVMTK
ncbi:PAS domain-containing sensor histidine kinase [Ammoniphilus resinae]|uniref:histidine kinase n=1 Tax=Ammoniphilus resinae TaxID=861532 RepID=A0ABS4GXR1_9BACL|nr:PAS domain S-box protein [Ammoniphilus resinae]MBP1935057.1 PAS domain S-box-containing protein [Ammoniphilus resinae]